VYNKMKDCEVRRAGTRQRKRPDESVDETLVLSGLLQGGVVGDSTALTAAMRALAEPRISGFGRSDLRAQRPGAIWPCFFSSLLRLRL
jgi:hypothetical protein